MTGLRLLPAILAVLPLAAAAQTSFSVSALSDFRVRGLSYSQGKPVLQLAANHDFAGGAYAGAFSSRAKVKGSAVDGAASAYAGVAQRGEAFTWDVGVVRTFYSGVRHYRYHEWYAAAGIERLSARLSYSPAYLGTGGRTAYVELNGSYPLAGEVDLVAHVGWLKPFDDKPGWYYSQLQRPDWRIGLHGTAGDWSLQLAWSGTRKAAGVFPGWRYGETRGLVIGATRHF